MRRPLRLTASLVALLASACGSSGPPAPPPPAACDAFQDLDCLDAGRAVSDVAVLASPAMAGRGTGSPGNLAAAAYVADRFQALGLSHAAGLAGWEQPFPLPLWTPGPSAALTVAGQDVPFEGVVGSIAGDVTGELVFAGYGISVGPYRRADAYEGTFSYAGCPLPEAGWDDFAGLDLRGKVVVMMRRQPGGSTALCPPRADLCERSTEGICWPYGVLTKLRQAADRGAAAVILVNQPGDGSTPVMLARLMATAAHPGVPVLWAHRDQLVARVPGLAAWAATAAGGVPASHATGLTARVQVTGTSAVGDVPNVLGVLPGTDPALRDEVVVIGAHLDHLGRTPWSGITFPGADDNASGTAVVLELARAFAGSATRPRRTLVFAAWNAEELGLHGSCHYVGAPPYPLAATVAAISVDMVGQGPATGLELYGTSPDPAPTVGDVMRGAAAAAGLGLAATSGGPLSTDAVLEASDHVCFGYAGVPAVLAITPAPTGQPDHVAYHTPDDLPGLVSQANVDAALRLLFVTTRAYAMGEEGAWLPAPRVEARAQPQGPAPRPTLRGDRFTP